MNDTNPIPQPVTKESYSPSDTTMMNDSNEKTIPFLRRLVDMLSENENVISFTPGGIDKKGQVITLGRVNVHDRIRVEKDILPKYFNHSSFASLRRQLNYFNFVREGKGRQKGAVYCNDKVVQLEDILRLRRRPTTAGTTPSGETTVVATTVSDSSSADEHTSDNSNGQSKRRSAIASKKRSRRQQDQDKSSHKSSRKNTTILLPTAMAAAAAAPKVVSPRSSPSGSPASSPTSSGTAAASRISLDLTLPPVETSVFAAGAATTTRSTSCSFMDEFASDEDVLGVSQILVSMSAAAAATWTTA